MASRSRLRPRAKARDAAGAIWSALQDHALARFGFRRNERIGPFTADVACTSARLVILIGEGAPEREQWLRAAGYRVLTFTAAETSNPDRVLEAIAGAFELRVVPARAEEH